MHIVILLRNDRPEFESVFEFESEQAASNWAKKMTEAQNEFSCVVGISQKPPEIIWNKYRHLNKVRQLIEFGTQEDVCSPFVQPYVCVIHEPTRRGYYLNRNYGFICSVANIIRPGCPRNEDYVPQTLKRVIKHETVHSHQAGSFTTPEWAKEYSWKEFTSYWLF